MTGWRVFSRPPGSPVAMLVHPRYGRMQWVLYVKKAGRPTRCDACGDVIHLSDRGYRPAIQSSQTSRLRLHASCVAKLGAA